jgi:hypothetical protein
MRATIQSVITAGGVTHEISHLPSGDGTLEPRTVKVIKTIVGSARSLGWPPEKVRKTLVDTVAKSCRGEGMSDLVVETCVAELGRLLTALGI